MKFVSALVLLEQGKAIRPTVWPKGVRMRLHNGYTIMETDERRAPMPDNCGLDNYLKLDWELYIEEKSDENTTKSS